MRREIAEFDDHLADEVQALADRHDNEHWRVVQFIERCTDDLLVPITVLPETDYLISVRVGGAVAARVLDSIEQGELRRESVTSADLPRILALMRQYADTSIGFVDASIVAVAERLGVESVLTRDRRHVGPIPPTHCAAVSSLP